MSEPSDLSGYGDGPLVSCIIPVFNGETFLLEAIKSARAQTSVRIEIIVVDDGSQDRSAEIAGNVEGVRVVRQTNGGLASARNHGLGLATGNLIAFLDADDVWMPGKIAAQLAALEATPSADYCICNVQDFSEDNSYRLPNDGRPRLGRLMQCTLAWRRAFDRVGGFAAEMATRTDQDWFIRAGERGLVELLVPEVLVRRRIHAGNFSRLMDSRLGTDWLTIARRTLKRKRAAGQDPRELKRWTFQSSQ